jgi:hypothetical protein
MSKEIQPTVLYIVQAHWLTYETVPKCHPFRTHVTWNRKFKALQPGLKIHKANLPFV